MAITSNTHHAYLNTTVIIYNDGLNPVTLIDSLTSKEYVVYEEATLQLCAGKHTLRNVDTDESLTITIEDAIKIGGSAFKKEACFLSEDTPWVFVTMKDRMYVYNQNTRKGRVEYGVAPDEILFTKNEGLDIFILRTENDFTIFDVSDNYVLVAFQNLIYYNDHIVVYKMDGTIYVYDFLQGVILYNFDQDYSIRLGENESSLYFISGSCVKAFNLIDDTETVISGISIDADSCKVSFRGYCGTTKGYCLSDKWFVTSGCVVDMSTLKYETFTLEDRPKVIKILNNEILTKEQFEEELDTFRQDCFDAINKNPYIHLTTKYASYENLFERGGSIYLKYRTKRYEIVSRYVKQDAFEYHVLSVSSGTDRIVASNEYYATGRHKQETTTTQSPKVGRGNLLANTEANNFVLIEENGSLIIVDLQNGIERQILTELFDSTFCTNAFFTSDGKHVLLEKSVGVRDFFELDTYESASFPIEGVPTNRFIGTNGYKPLADHTAAPGAAPVWIDPLTMRRVTPSALNARSYVSPNGLIQVETNFKSCLFDNLTNVEISSDRFHEYRKKYNWNGTIEDDEKKAIVELRRELVKKYQDVFDSQIVKYLHLQENKPEEVKNTLNRMIETSSEFTQLFVDRLDYVCYNDNGVEKKVLIGRSAWYLNYVSFSKDSRYMSFGAKMNSDFFRCSQDGVFVIYDLIEENEVVRMDSNQGLWAVWTTQFSQRNDVACYDGQPKTYVKMHKSNELLTLSDRSFLCFSPSGNYMALSEQGYIDYTHHPNAQWGHQPSTNVYVHPVDSSASFNFLGPYSDLGEDVCGTSKSTQRFNIASAAFSIDEKRLLMVGEDGVVVVRNLHLEELPNSETFSTHLDKDGDVWTNRKVSFNF